MNKLFIYSLLICCTAIALGSCTKYLDEKPDNLLTTDLVWQKRSTTESYLNQVYSHVLIQADDYTTLGGSDETTCALAGVNVRKMVTGNWMMARLIVSQLRCK